MLSLDISGPLGHLLLQHVPQKGCPFSILSLLLQFNLRFLFVYLVLFFLCLLFDHLLLSIDLLLLLFDKLSHLFKSFNKLAFPENQVFREDGFEEPPCAPVFEPPLDFDD